MICPSISEAARSAPTFTIDELGRDGIDDRGDCRREGTRRGVENEDPPETVEELQLPLHKRRPCFALLIIEIGLRHIEFIDLFHRREVGDFPRMNRQFVLASLDRRFCLHER